MRRALVLGAGGFLGSHLTRRLVADGWDVTGVVQDGTAPHVRSRLQHAIDDVRLIDGDATDADLLNQLVRGVDVVFPLAGQSGAARSLHRPVEDAAANAAGQLVVLEAIRHHNPDARTFFAGSRLQYGRAVALPVSESHPQEPTSIYGLHKMVGERYHLLYHALHGVQTCSLRISNPYGPGQDRPDRAFGVVGTFFATASAGDAIRLYGGGTQLRDYIFIDDLIDLILLAVSAPNAVGIALNASGPAPVSLRDMALAVVEAVGGGVIENVPWPADERAIETGDYVGDISLAAGLLGWRPTVSLRDGLERTWLALEPALTPT